MYATRYRHGFRRALGTEWLERRHPLAGDVAIALLGNQLVIEGDAEANALVVERAEGGGFNITGAMAGDGATTINGGNDPFRVASFDSNMLVNLGAGDDSFTLGNDAGNGNSSLFRLHGSLMTDLGEGDDTFTAHVNSQSDIILLAGAGADDISVSGRIGSFVAMADPLNSDGAGADNVHLADLRAKEDISVFTLAGDDQVSLSGDLRLHGNLTIDTGIGTDGLSLTASRFVVRGEISIDPLSDTTLEPPNEGSDGIVGEAMADAASLPTASLLSEDLSHPLTSSTAFANALLHADPVGAGNAGLSLDTGASIADDSLVADSSLIADAELGLTGVELNGSLNSSGSAEMSAALDDVSLADLTSTNFASNITSDTNLASDLTTSDDTSQSALLQNAAALAANGNPFRLAATDNVFNQFDESELIGSAARNPTFLNNISEDNSLNSAINQLALSQPLMPVF